MGGEAPARSPLTLRAILAGFGLVFCSVSAVALYWIDGHPWLVGLFVILAVVAAVDLMVILWRKRRGEPG